VCSNAGNHEGNTACDATEMTGLVECSSNYGYAIVNAVSTTTLNVSFVQSGCYGNVPTCDSYAYSTTIIQNNHGPRHF
jgi:hypothetical protein